MGKVNICKQGLQTQDFFFRITVLPYFSVEVNEVHVFLSNSILSMAMTPVNSVYMLHAAHFVVEAT